MGEDPSSQTMGSSLRARSWAKPAKKIGKKSDFGEFACREKYIQLLLNEHIWQGQTFDKPPYYQKNHFKMRRVAQLMFLYSKSEYQIHGSS